MSDIRLTSFTFKQTSWLDSSNDILSIRHKVFMIEQHFQDNKLYSHQDIDAFHIIVRNQEQKVVACGRITPKGRIGKIAVMLPYRGIGIGSDLLKKLIQIGRKNAIYDLSLNANLDSQSFYQLQKFSTAGPVFMKYGIPHRRLARKLA